MLPPPTAEQQIVLDAVAALYMRHGKWPRWAWVDELLDNRGLDGLAVYQSFPREYTVQYGYIGNSHVTPVPNLQISLTIAGLSYVDGAQPLVRLFLNLLDAFGTCRSRISTFSVLRPLAYP